MSLLWVTNLPAPYRFPAWDLIAEREGLEVWFIAAKADDAHGWPAAPTGDHPWSWRPMHSRTVSVGGTPVLVPRQSLPSLDAFSGVVLGGWESPWYWWLSMKARRARKPSLAFYESTALSHRYPAGVVGAARSRFFLRQDAIITPGTLSTEAIRRMGARPERIFQAFNSVDVRGFAERVAAIRAQQPAATDGGHRYLFVGQLIPRKNVAALISAFVDVAGPDDTLTVAGDGPLRADLEKQAAAAGLTDRVRFRGLLDERGVVAELATHHTLVLPSTEEVWGLVVNEALAAGLHVVVSDRCGVTPDVAPMRGVWTCSPTVGDIGRAMADSRAAWTGVIESPEILLLGADNIGEKTLEALAFVTAARSSKA